MSILGRLPYKRWTQEGEVKADGRPNAERPEPANKLTPEEKHQVLEICNEEAWQSLPPSQIVPALADEGVYIASESSFYRILKEAGQLHHRGRAQAPKKVSKPKSYKATAPNQVWSWDISVPQQAAGEMRDYGPSSSACRCW